jgi:YVTN family beta-propeller protein
MRSLRTLLSISVALVVVSVAQAKTNYAYTANFNANTVSVINTSNNTAVATISVGTRPWGAAVNQAGSVAYVTNAGSNSVSVISTSTNAVVATIPVGANPFGVAFSPNGKAAYVANYLSNSVSVINTGTKAVTATISVQSNPYGLAVTPNGAFVYVTNYQSGSLSVISTLTNKVVATISVGGTPTFLAVSPDGSTIYVPNYGSSTISVIRVADNTVVNTINVDAAWGAAVSPDGHWLYSTDYTSGATDLVTVIDTRTQAVAATIVVGSGPLEVSFSEDSAHAYVANSGSSTVSVINTASQTVVNTITGVGSYPIGVSVMGTVKVSTVAGGYVGDGPSALNAAIGGPYSSVYDSAGNLYISDFFMNRIRKVTPAGVISTYAGTGICGYNGDNIKSTKAMVCAPNGLALDAAGNLIVADGSNSRIRKISKSGTITTIAGNGVFGYSGDGGSALNAEIGQPFQLAYDAAGNLYFGQVSNSVVRKVDTTGKITTFAGTGTCGYNGDGIPATTAQLCFPLGVAVDSSNNVYIADNHRVRKVTPAGIISTFAGTGNPGFSGDGMLATSANIDSPHGLVVQNGVLYISNAGRSRFRFVDLTTNIINTYAGSSFGYDGDNHALLATEFSRPFFMLFDSSGNPVCDDALNGRVRKATGGIVNTIAGGYLGDGAKAISAALVLPEALAIDKLGNIFIADFTGNRVRKVSAGIISTIAGTGITGYSGDTGPATSATLNSPLGVAVDSTGNVFIADSLNNVIRKVDTTGTITTFATNADFCDLLQMATDSANNLYVADDCTSVIFKVTPAGVVSVFAGVPFTYGYNGDGITAITAHLNLPFGVAVDKNGNVLIADYGNNRVREVNTSGIINTIAGNGTPGHTGDGGAATSATLNSPLGVAVDSTGNVFIADASNNAIRKVDTTGTITTFAGAGYGFNGDGLWPLYTKLDDPVAVAVDSKGAVYELDDVDHRVRKIQ